MDKNSHEKSFLKLPFFLLIAYYLIISALVFRYGTAFSDEGLLYQWGLRILAGELPYTDFFLQMAPGTFYIQAALMKLFGTSILVGRIFKQIEGLFAGIMIYLIVMRALKNKHAALIAMVLSFAWSGALHIRFHWYTMDAGILVLIGIYFFVRFIESCKLKMLALSGLSIGSSILFKQNMGIFAFVAGAVLCVAHGLRDKRIGIMKWMFIFIVTMITPLILFIMYYVWAGGDIYKLYLQTMVYPQKMYGYTSLLEILLYPLKVFLLIHKQDPRYYIGIIFLILSLLCILARLKLPFIKIIGVLLLSGIILWDLGIFARFSIWTLNFILFVAAITLSAYTAFKNKDETLSFYRLTLSLFAFSNLYGGIMVGGGLGRFVETMTGSFYIYGVLVDFAENDTAVRAFWDKAISWSQRQCVNIGTISYSVLGLMMIIQNISFTPGLDFPLYRLNQTMHIEGAKGIIGEKKYVNETESTVNYVRNILTQQNNDKREIFVFPLNSMLYPLISARNPTTYDVLQSIPFTPEFIPDLMAQLEKARPKIIIAQKRTTPTTGLLRDEKVWVHQEVVDAIYKFVEKNYVKIYETELYYEVYKLKDSQLHIGLMK